MSFKHLPVIKQFHKYKQLVKQLENRVTKLEEILHLIQQDPELAAKKHSYKSIISESPTAWYGHFEKAVSICDILKPKVTVDLGVDFGYSTFAFAFLKTGEVYGLDSFEGDEHAGLKETYSSVLELNDRIKKEYDIDNVHFIKGYFDDIARDWQKPIDLLHIDGLHTYEAVKNDFNTWSKFLNKNSVVLFHDTMSYKKDVGRFFKELKGFKYNFEDWNGLGLWTLNENFYNRLMHLYNHSY